MVSDKKPVRYIAMVGLSLADKDGETRVEAGELVPVRFNEQLPETWVGRKVEVVK